MRLSHQASGFTRVQETRPSFASNLSSLGFEVSCSKHEAERFMNSVAALWGHFASVSDNQASPSCSEQDVQKKLMVQAMGDRLDGDKACFTEVPFAGDALPAYDWSGSTMAPFTSFCV